MGGQLQQEPTAHGRHRWGRRFSGEINAALLLALVLAQGEKQIGFVGQFRPAGGQLPFVDGFNHRCIGQHARGDDAMVARALAHLQFGETGGNAGRIATNADVQGGEGDKGRGMASHHGSPDAPAAHRIQDHRLAARRGLATHAGGDPRQ